MRMRDGILTTRAAGSGARAAIVWIILLQDGKHGREGLSKDVEYWIQRLRGVPAITSLSGSMCPSLPSRHRKRTEDAKNPRIERRLDLHHTPGPYAPDHCCPHSTHELEAHSPSFFPPRAISYCTRSGCLPCQGCRWSAKLSHSGWGIRGNMPIFTMTIVGKISAIDMIGLQRSHVSTAYNNTDNKEDRCKQIPARTISALDSVSTLRKPHTRPKLAMEQKKVHTSHTPHKNTSPPPSHCPSHDPHISSSPPSHPQP